MSEAVEKLNAMYPNLGKTRIEATLNECNGDTTSTIVRLQQMQQQQPVVIQQIQQPILSEGNGNTVNSTTNTNQTRVIVVQQPQPMQTVVVYQDPNNMSPEQRDTYIKQSMMTNNGNCWRITLIVLWSIILAGAVALFMTGVIFAFAYGIDDWGMVFFLMFGVPGAIEIACISLCIHGANKYLYGYMVFGCVWSGIHTLLGLIQVIQWLVSYPVVVISVLPPLIYFSCIFAFSIILTKKISELGGKCDCCA
eukprot:70236_1